MSVYGISSYQDALFKWQGQQLKNTGASATSSSASSAVNSLFNSNSSMISQISSMVELTKYAMDKMGLSSDSRVTFSQIAKYREQLQADFSQNVKNGFMQAGIENLSALTFSVDQSGKISVSGTNASDRQKAQAWLEANPSYGQEIRKAMNANGLEGAEIDFNISSTGRMNIVDNVTSRVQSSIDANAELSDKLRQAVSDLGYTEELPIELTFSGDGQLKVKGDGKDALNEWLSANGELASVIKKQLDANGAQISAATLRLGKEGSIQISVNNADNNDAQKILDSMEATGSKMKAGLDNLAIDPNINFTMQVNEDGSVTIISDHPDRDKVQRFFDENPELIKQYRQIETLAGIDDARKAMQISPAAMRKRIQIESLSAWWAGSGDADSYFGNYADGNLSLMTGLNLNI